MKWTCSVTFWDSYWCFHLVHCIVGDKQPSYDAQLSRHYILLHLSSCKVTKILVNQYVKYKAIKAIQYIIWKTTCIFGLCMYKLWKYTIFINYPKNLLCSQILHHYHLKLLQGNHMYKKLWWVLMQHLLPPLSSME